MPQVAESPLDALTVPRYTQGAVAHLLGASQATFQRWTQGYRTWSGREMEPLVSGVRPGRGYTVPFLSLAEAYVVRSFLREGVRMRHIRDNVEAIRSELGMEYALASRRLKTDGAVILWESERAADDTDGDASLVVYVNGQGVFRETVAERLKTITYGHDYAARVGIPVEGDVEIDVDPRRSFGQPTLAGTGVRVDDLLSRWKAGESISTLAWDYDIASEAIESVLRRAA